MCADEIMEPIISLCDGMEIAWFCSLRYPCLPRQQCVETTHICGYKRDNSGLYAL